MLQKSLVQKCCQPAFLSIAQRDFAVSEKQLKIRMKSVGSIGKITAAMKMVSASKMKGDLNRLERGKDFGCHSVDMLFKSDQFMQRRMPAEPADPKTLIVPITSDKGLCGAVNSIIVRDVKKLVANSNRAKLEIFSIGEKGSVGFTRPFPDLLKQSISQVNTPYNYPTVMGMANEVAHHS
jgi:F-type H+-transporting ATPase subunit gamma